MDFLARFWDTEELGGAGPCLGGAAGGCVGFCCVNLGECMLVRVRRYEGSIKIIGVQLVVWEGDVEVVVAIGMRVRRYGGSIKVLRVQLVVLRR